MDNRYSKELRVISEEMLEKVSGVKIGRGKIEEIINAARITGLTGNYEVDFLNSREKRLYTGNDTEIRRAKNTSPLLLQTYMRDTGEILNDLALPIYVNGTHWGNCYVLPSTIENRPVCPSYGQCDV